MTETGRVLALKQGKVIVSVNRTDACGRCNRCSHFRLPSEDGDTITVEAVPVGHIQPGDLVQLEMPSGDFLKAVFAVYVMPLLALGSGYGLGFLLGTWAGSGGLWGTLGAAAGLLLWYAWLKGYDLSSRLAGRYLPLARAIGDAEL